MIIRNMSTMAVLNALKAVASFLVSFLVAHAVSPAAFGLVAFSIPLMTFITLLTDLGLTSAIVRHPELSRSEAGAAVALMGITGLIGGIVLAVLAHPIETALSLHGLAQVLVGYSLITLLSIWAAGPRALLERHYAYSRIALVETAALLIGLSVFAAAMALSAGVMALVAYQTTYNLVRSAAFIVLAREHYRLNLHVVRIMALVRVGGWVLVTNVMSYCARNLDNLLIGAYLGAASLGIYGLAYQVMTLPLVLLTWPVSGVLLSTLARLKMSSDGARANVVCAVMTVTAAISFPMMIFLTFGGRLPLNAIYAARWHGLADIVAILAPVGAIQSIAAFGGAVLTEKGAVRLNFFLSVLSGGTLSAVFFVTVWFGLPTLVAAYAVAATLVSCVLLYYMCRESGIGLRRFFDCMKPGLMAAVGGTIGVAATTGLNPQTPIGWVWSACAYLCIVLAVYFLLRRSLYDPIRALVRSSGELKGAAHA